MMIGFLRVMFRLLFVLSFILSLVLFIVFLETPTELGLKILFLMSFSVPISYWLAEGEEFNWNKTIKKQKKYLTWKF